MNLNKYILLDKNNSPIKESLTDNIIIYDNIERALVDANKVNNFAKAVKCQLIIEVEND